MPQASLLGWLGKPAAVTEPQPVNVASQAITVDDDISQLPTPPSSSQEVNSSTPTSPKLKQGTGPKRLYGAGARSLSPNVELRTCRKEDISNLKRLTGLLLPIPYPEKFYRDIIEDPVTSNITLLAMWHDNADSIRKEKGTLVGAIRCRILASPPVPVTTDGLNKEGPMLYLSTLVLLSPYRTHGIATHMLDILVKRAIEAYGVTSIGAHVWEANTEGLEWYRKRGFEQVAKEDSYYRRLKPQGAVVVRRRVRVVDLMNG